MNVHARRVLSVLLLASLLVSDGRGTVGAAGQWPARNTPPIAIRWVTRLVSALRSSERRLRLGFRRVEQSHPPALQRRSGLRIRTLLLIHSLFRLPPPWVA